jgi:hypothetical protein
MAAPIHFYVVDLGVAVRFDLRGGVVEAMQRSKMECDMALASQALWYAFKFPWGSEPWMCPAVTWYLIPK